ncbi:hypothetical protein NV379_01870 [Paenibacillus sp. N1-5-1-14]|uniref:hypothetical protein n=1 Tax=Paenibacillus radicibacter TaxID=2972488 RepID=UPI00215996F0|nr:hypothetical protein [Paenibacillus radicibacter]MCR8641392.1 hypothetical protein [Paenibacillus radicibacter]
MHYHECRDKLVVGDFVYICDYRFKDINNKAIRHIKPVKVIVCSNEDLPKNKRVYYSEHHFKPVDKNGKVKAQIIAPYDNTGYRFHTGTSLNIFFNERDCVKKYKNQCLEILEQFNKAKAAKIDYFDKMIEEISNEL